MAITIKKLGIDPEIQKSRIVQKKRENLPHVDPSKPHIFSGQVSTQALATTFRPTLGSPWDDEDFSSGLWGVPRIFQRKLVVLWKYLGVWYIHMYIRKPE